MHGFLLNSESKPVPGFHYQAFCAVLAKFSEFPFFEYTECLIDTALATHILWIEDIAEILGAQAV